MAVKPKFVVVMFYENGEHEKFKQDVGLGIPSDAAYDNKVEFIYVATSEADADAMISERIEKANELKKSKDVVLRNLADKLIETLDDSVNAELADLAVAGVAKSIYNDVLGIPGNIVIDKEQPVARVHGGFGPGGKKSTAIIAKYKFEESNDGNERPNRSTDSPSEAAQE